MAGQCEKENTFRKLIYRWARKFPFAIACSDYFSKFLQ